MVNGFNGLLFVLLLVGTFYSVSQPGGSKVIMKWFSKENRGLAMGIRQAGIPIGGTLAGVLIPFLTIKYNMAYAVNSIACICIIEGFYFLYFIRNHIFKRKLNKNVVNFLLDAVKRSDV